MNECSHLVLSYYFPIAEIGDILDISELGEPNLPPINIPILPPVDKIKYPQPIIGLPVERELAYRRKRSPFEGIHVIFIGTNAQRFVITY